MPRLRRSLLVHLAVIALYALVAIIYTWPLACDLGGLLIGGASNDANEMVRHTWWFGYAVRNSQDLLWQSHLAYPDGFAGFVFQANLLQYAPPAVLGLLFGPVAGLNLATLLALALNGWAMWWLVRTLLGAQAGWVAPLLAGLVFCAAPTFQGHLFDGHTGLIVMWPVPLLVRALWHLLAQPRWHWGWFGQSLLWFFFSPSGHMLQAIYVLAPLLGLWAVALLWRREYPQLGRLMAVGACGGLILLVYLIPPIQATFASAEAYVETTYVRYSMDALAIVTPSFDHPLWGQLAYPSAVLGVNIVEGHGYLGILPALLAVVGVWRVRPARWWLLLAIVAGVLALGPLLKVLDQPMRIALGDYETYITLPLALVQNLPGFNLARTPGRFNFTLALALAVMAGYGAQIIWQNRRQAVGLGLAGLAGLLILLDYQTFWPMPNQPARQPAGVLALRGDENVRAVLDLPWQSLLAAKDALYLQSLHERPLIAGQLTRQTPVSPAHLNVLQATLDPALLKRAGADVVILHKDHARTLGLLEALVGRTRAQLGQPIYEDDHLAVYRTPDALGAELTVFAPAPITVEDQTYIDFFAPHESWLDFTLDLSAPDRLIHLDLDGRFIQSWQQNGSSVRRFAIPVEAGGTYRLSLALQPPCPARYDPTLTCRGLTLNLAQAQDTGLAVGNFLAFDGVRLRAAATTIEDETLIVRLWWSFDRDINIDQIRFVHVLDETRTNQLQDDRDLDLRRAGTDWVETLALPLDGLAPGAYSVRVGWYAFHSLVRYPVIGGEAVGAQDGAPEIATFNWPATEE